jgi:hypothetical protein
MIIVGLKVDWRGRFKELNNVSRSFGNLLKFGTGRKISDQIIKYILPLVSSFL